MTRWCSGRALDSWSRGRGFDSDRGIIRATTWASCSYLMCLCSPSSITWYLARAFMLKAPYCWQRHKVQWTRGYCRAVLRWFSNCIEPRYKSSALPFYSLMWTILTGHCWCWCRSDCLCRTVGGIYRLALFALQDIEAGTELTYDYNFHSYNVNSQVLLHKFIILAKKSWSSEWFFLKPVNWCSSRGHMFKSSTPIGFTVHLPHYTLWLIVARFLVCSCLST